MSNEITREELRIKLKEKMELIETVLKTDEPTEHEKYYNPLNIETTKMVNILLSWGDPADGFKLSYSNENKLLGGVYYWQNWGTYNETYLITEEAEKIEQLYLGGDPTATK